MTNGRLRFLTRRRERSKPSTPPWAGGGWKDVLFVFDQAGAWTRYRSEHQVEALRFAGLAAELVQTGSADLLEAVDHYACFVLNRVEWSDDVAEFCERAADRGRTLVFDTDDLIFEPDLLHHFAVFDGWPERERKLQVAKLDRYRRTLASCAATTVTTDPLREHALRYTNEVHVLANSVSKEMVRLGDQALGARRRRGDTVTVAYLSGTRTHNRDFLEAASAVLWALDTYPHLRFQAVGKLELDERFAAFGKRVERIPIQPWQVLPGLLRRIDVNLAPLERANPVTECKSCVKYLEAGLVGVPTIASARPDFVRVIEPGRNGLLADGEDEWRDALRRLVESPNLRSEMGEVASEDIRRRHTTTARAGLLAETFRRFVPAGVG